MLRTTRTSGPKPPENGIHKVPTIRQERRIEAKKRAERIPVTTAFGSTFGTRVQKARVKAKLTQGQVADYIGLGRTSVTQWEAERSVPDLETVKMVAHLLGEEPWWLAYGVRQNTKVGQSEHLKMNQTSVPEIVFGYSPSETVQISDNTMRTSRLIEMGVNDPSDVVLFKLLVGLDARYEVGDYLLVDRGATQPSPPGTFLYWDGIGPAIADLNIVSASHSGQTSIRVNVGNVKFEMDASKLKILGRVIGVQKRV